MNKLAEQDVVAPRGNLSDVGSTRSPSRISESASVIGHSSEDKDVSPTDDSLSDSDTEHRSSKAEPRIKSRASNRQSDENDAHAVFTAELSRKPVEGSCSGVIPPLSTKEYIPSAQKASTALVEGMTDRSAASRADSSAELAAPSLESDAMRSAGSDACDSDSGTASASASDSAGYSDSDFGDDDDPVDVDDGVAPTCDASGLNFSSAASTCEDVPRSPTTNGASGHLQGAISSATGRGRGSEASPRVSLSTKTTSAGSESNEKVSGPTTSPSISKEDSFSQTIHDSDILSTTETQDFIEKEDRAYSQQHESTSETSASSGSSPGAAEISDGCKRGSQSLDQIDPPPPPDAIPSQHIDVEVGAPKLSDRSSIELESVNELQDFIEKEDRAYSQQRESTRGTSASSESSPEAEISDGCKRGSQSLDQIDTPPPPDAIPSQPQHIDVEVGAPKLSDRSSIELESVNELSSTEALDLPSGVVSAVTAVEDESRDMGQAAISPETQSLVDPPSIEEASGSIFDTGSNLHKPILVGRSDVAESVCSTLRIVSELSATTSDRERSDGAHVEDIDGGREVREYTDTDSTQKPESELGKSNLETLSHEGGDTSGGTGTHDNDGFVEDYSNSRGREFENNRSIEESCAPTTGIPRRELEVHPQTSVDDVRTHNTSSLEEPRVSISSCESTDESPTDMALAGRRDSTRCAEEEVSTDATHSPSMSIDREQTLRSESGDVIAARQVIQSEVELSNPAEAAFDPLGGVSPRSGLYARPSNVLCHAPGVVVGHSEPRDANSGSRLKDETAGETIDTGLSHPLPMHTQQAPDSDSDDNYTEFQESFCEAANEEVTVDRSHETPQDISEAHASHADSCETSSSANDVADVGSGFQPPVSESDDGETVDLRGDEDSLEVCPYSDREAISNIESSVSVQKLCAHLEEATASTPEYNSNESTVSHNNHSEKPAERTSPLGDFENAPAQMKAGDLIERLPLSSHGGDLNDRIDSPSLPSDAGCEGTKRSDVVRQRLKHSDDGSEGTKRGDSLKISGERRTATYKVNSIAPEQMLATIVPQAPSVEVDRKPERDVVGVSRRERARMRKAEREKQIAANRDKCLERIRLAKVKERELVKKMEKEVEAERQQREYERSKKHREFATQQKARRRKHAKLVNARKKTKKSASMLLGRGEGLTHVHSQDLTHVHSQDLTVVDTSETSAHAHPHPPPDPDARGNSVCFPRKSGKSRQLRPLTGNLGQLSFSPQNARELEGAHKRPQTSDGSRNLRNRNAAALSPCGSKSSGNKENVCQSSKGAKSLRNRAQSSPPRSRNKTLRSPPGGRRRLVEKIESSPSVGVALPTSRAGTYYPGDVENARFAVPALSLTTHGGCSPLTSPAPRRRRWTPSPATSPRSRHEPQVQSARRPSCSILPQVVPPLRSARRVNDRKTSPPRRKPESHFVRPPATKGFPTDTKHDVMRRVSMPTSAPTSMFSTSRGRYSRRRAPDKALVSASSANRYHGHVPPLSSHRRSAARSINKMPRQQTGGEAAAPKKRELPKKLEKLEREFESQWDTWMNDVYSGDVIEDMKSAGLIKCDSTFTGSHSQRSSLPPE